jgi:ribosomal protein S27AE
MPRLSCWSCGRQLYTVSPLSALFEEERRCPRCGAFLHEDRRDADRRLTHRRTNPPNDPGPPMTKGKTKGARKVALERRVADRRTVRRRGDSSGKGGAASDMGGWQD